MLVKILLIIGIAGILAYFLGNRNAMRLRAGKKILFVFFILASVISILNPELLNLTAHFINVGRGADLLLYMMIVAFIFVSLNIYLKFQELARRQAEVVRSIALLEERLKRAAQDGSKK